MKWYLRVNNWCGAWQWLSRATFVSSTSACTLLMWHLLQENDHIMLYLVANQRLNDEFWLKTNILLNTSYIMVILRSRLYCYLIYDEQVMECRHLYWVNEKKCAHRIGVKTRIAVFLMTCRMVLIMDSFLSFRLLLTHIKTWRCNNCNLNHSFC